MNGTVVLCGSLGSTGVMWQSLCEDFPNIGQQFLYLWTGATNNSGTFDIQSFRIPNGGE